MGHDLIVSVVFFLGGIIVVCLRANDILDLLNYTNMGILLRKCFLETETRGQMAEGCVGMNCGKELEVQRQAIIFSRHLGEKRMACPTNQKCLRRQECGEQRR